MYSFSGPEIFYVDVFFFAHYFYASMPVRGVVELLIDLLHSLDLLEVHSEVHFMLFQVNEALIGLS